jgi:hypothetical protein
LQLIKRGQATLPHRSLCRVQCDNGCSFLANAGDFLDAKDDADE